MVNILIVAVLGLADWSPHKLGCKIDWQTNTSFNGVIVKSEKPLSKQNILYVEEHLSKANRQFVKYVRKQCPTLKDLEIRIISSQQLNSRSCFPYRQDNEEYYGEYYRSPNVMYITPKIFDNDRVLIHEYFHYMYDECKVFIQEEEEEHRQIKILLDNRDK